MARPELGLKRQCMSCGAKFYDLARDPAVCPKCGAEMKVIAVIEDPLEIRRILRHLVKIGRSPPGFKVASID